MVDAKQPNSAELLSSFLCAPKDCTKFRMHKSKPRKEAKGLTKKIGVSLKIGPLAAKFAGKIALSDINAPHSYTIAFEGQGGPAGFGKGNAKVQLNPNPDGLALAYTVQASVGGKIAQVGQRLIDGVAKSMAEDFFKRFDEEMQKRYPQAYAEKPQAAAAADTPSGIPTWVWLAVGAALVAAFLLLR
jgi:carbon monoxide dehydrogenase subunit G